ncbi:MAG: hypothetical protein ACE3L7_14335, partial [Candidatus Pristimantibacillus sp.]
MQKKIRPYISSLLVILVLLSGLPLQVFGATDDLITKSIPVLFNGETYDFSTNSTMSRTVELQVPSGYKVKSFQVWTMIADSANKLKLTNKGTLSSKETDGKLPISSFPGTKVKVENLKGYTSTMNYIINRRSNGKEWIVEGSGAGPYYVTPGASDPCWKGGITVCAGMLPAKDNTGKTISGSLRESDGSATQTSNNLPSPLEYDFNNHQVLKKDVILNTIKIREAVPVNEFFQVKKILPGTEEGKGRLQVITKLNLDNTLGAMFGCPGCSGLAGEMRYELNTNTKWIGDSYYYEGEVRVTYEKLPPKDKPIVECSCTVDPSTVQFADKDISATSTLTASVKQKGTLKVKEWKLYGRLADGSQLQTQTLGPIDSVTNKFAFTIPKEKLKDVDSYTETYVMRAVIYFTDGTSADNMIECTTVVTKPGVATPAPSPSPGSTPEPTPTPKPVLEIKAKWNPISIYTGETSTLSAEGKGFTEWSWEYSDNLNPLMRDNTDLYYENIKFDEAGVYTAKITVTNDEGDSKSDTAFLYVNDPKPVALISGVTRWVQGRTFPSLHHLNNSYTPLANRGVTIDFSKSEIKYKKNDAADYIVGSWPDKAPMELGDYTLEGKVYDSQGRVSEWAKHPLEIIPDQPPTVEIFAAEEGVRNNDLIINIEAESPDGDTITHLYLEERYDSDNDGDFEEESWKLLYDGVFKSSHPAKYTTVGKRQYRAVVT